jgi:hypothetical protein
MIGSSDAAGQGWGKEAEVHLHFLVCLNCELSLHTSVRLLLVGKEYALFPSETIFQLKQTGSELLKLRYILPMKMFSSSQH